MFELQIYKHRVFTHHGLTFIIEADDWLEEEAANAAIIGLHIWALQLGAEETAGLHSAPEQQREAVVREISMTTTLRPFPLSETHSYRPCRPVYGDGELESCSRA